MCWLDFGVKRSKVEVIAGRGITQWQAIEFHVVNTCELLECRELSEDKLTLIFVTVLWILLICSCLSLYVHLCLMLQLKYVSYTYHMCDWHVYDKLLLTYLLTFLWHAGTVGWNVCRFVLSPPTLFIAVCSHLSLGICSVYVLLMNSENLIKMFAAETQDVILSLATVA